MDMCGMMLIDMHGVRYAKNLLKNPATKRLSGIKWLSQPPTYLAHPLERSMLPKKIAFCNT